jgi:tRNA threonylcarbamoyladenosine biosynthesis protein TsaB
LAAPVRGVKVHNPNRTATLSGQGVTATSGEPIVLALDSAGSGCSVVLAAGETVLAAGGCSNARGQTERLLPIVDAVMRKSGLSAASLNIVAATIGPGSFTGIRIGLAAARGIALATGACSVGVTGFEAVAANLAPRARERGASFVLIALESRREDLYIQLFDPAHHPLGDPIAAMPAALDEALRDLIGEAPLIVAGDAARRAAHMLLARSGMIVVEGSAPDATGVLRAVLRRARSGELYAPPLPLYLRPPDVTFSTTRQDIGR